MKEFFFCARNIEDYVKPLDNNFDLTDENIIFNEEIQDLFSKIIKSHFDEKRYVNAPISDEIVTGIEGVKLDFNFGLRLEIPAGNWHVTIGDFDSDLIFFDKDISDVKLISLEKYFIRWHIEIFRDGKKIFTHTLNVEGKQILIYIPPLGMGDIISMLPYVEEFRRQNNCRLTLTLPKYLRELAAHLYPKIEISEKPANKFYASYHLFMPMNILPVWVADIRNYPLGRIAAIALGLKEIAPKPNFKPTAPPVTSEKYVCVAVQASTTSKGWLYPDGWNILVKYLKSLGYRIFCIDREKICSRGKLEITIRKPEDAEDFTGDFPIMARANMLYHAEFFIGLSSGLAWLADAVDCPTVLICGFSQDWSEFYTPYRVANRNVCNGCVNDVRVNFLNEGCPYHKGTPRELECQKKISPKQVIETVENLIIEEKLVPPILR